MTTLSPARARRIALAAQGFARRRPEGRVDVRHLRRVFEDLGVLQLDFVNVVAPSHFLVLFSRLGAYPRRRLHDLAYRRREVTEGWAHEACLIPLEHWPLLAHRRRAFSPRPRGFATLLERQPEYVEGVMEWVRREGPLGPQDLPWPEGGERRLEHAWFGDIRRAALEHHFGRGRLAVHRRLDNFARVYDLTERIVPAEHRAVTLDRRTARRRLLLLAARAHGIGTAADLADYVRMKMAAARPLLAEFVAEGRLKEVAVRGWRQPAYLHPQARQPRRLTASTLLSPFDPVIWFRRRAQRLFEFDYRFEIFIPRHKRRWGAYVLPFLLGDRLVARVDLKARRESRVLAVKGAWLEEGADPLKVAPALAKELRSLAEWLGLEAGVEVGAVGDLAGVLAGAVNRTPT